MILRSLSIRVSPIKLQIKLFWKVKVAFVQAQFEKIFFNLTWLNIKTSQGLHAILTTVILLHIGIHLICYSSEKLIKLIYWLTPEEEKQLPNQNKPKDLSSAAEIR